MPHPLYLNFTTQAEIDAQYNAGASVPEAAACLRHYTDQATRARKMLPCLLDVPYGATLQINSKSIGSQINRVRSFNDAFA